MSAAGDCTNKAYHELMVRAETAERQVQTLRHMWDTVHRGLGLAPDVSLSPEMVVARVREAEAMRAMLQLVWDYSSGCPLSRDCAEIQCDGEACVVSALLAPAPPAP